ncbi:hypothetical protein V6N13_137871 [Hibiscus sabdariffa]
MSIFEMIDMVEKLGLTYTMKIFWLVSEKPFEVKLLASDNDVFEMVSKLPRNHYVHVYLEEVLTACSDANVEPYCNVEVSDVGSFEPEINVEVSDVAGSFEPDFNVEDNDDAASFEPDCNVEVSDAAIVSDDDSLEENIGEPSKIKVESNSDSEDIDYEASKSSTHESGFTDSDAEASDDVSDVHARVGDKVRVDIDDDSGHSDSLYSVDESDSDGPRRKQRFSEFNTTVDISDPSFKVGLLFATKQVLREAVKMYSIKNRYSVRLKRNDNRRIQAVCKAGCPWVLWASPVDLKEPCGTWQIKSLVVEHRCLKEYKNPNITSKFMAKQYLDAFNIDPNYSAKSLKQAVFRDYSIYLHLSKCCRAKNLALERLHGNVKEQYRKLYDYLAELRSSNPGTTTILQLNETVFERLYICMQAMKDGFKAGCRPIICLDGCHLKGYYGGHLLAAVGMDANDSLYPLAFAVVEVESESSWCWFLERLMSDFELNNSHHISFMTDRQKVETIKEKSLKDQLWKATRTTYVGEFEAAMSTLQMILEARDKSIITLVESIRSTLMQRIAKKSAEAEKLTGPLCPKIIAKLDNAIKQSHRCWPIRAGGSMYQVSCGHLDQHSVNMQTRTCSCRKWQLTCIPCIHAISVILLLEENPESYVDPCYSVSRQMTIYSHFITPVRGENQWTHQHGMTENVLPPILRRPPERPHKKRRREADEAPSQGGKVSKKGLKISCTKCGGSGHNTRTCKGLVRGNTRTHQKPSTTTRRIPKLRIRRSSPTMHQDQSTTPRPSQSDIPTPSSRPNHSDIPTPTLRPSQSHHPQSNIPKSSQPLPPPYNVRWMSTPTVPFTQESHTATPTQSSIHPQINIPRPSQPLPPPYNVRWMLTPTVPFTQESHTATPTQSDIHPQINIPSPSQPIPLTQESSVTQSSPQDLGENRLRSDP